VRNFEKDPPTIAEVGIFEKNPSPLPIVKKK
jgi:hypothetical protein